MSRVTAARNRGVTAIVCCHNSAAVIGETVQALASQELPRDFGYEIILVDNVCADGTVDVARKALADSPHPLRIIEEAQTGLAHARRRGVTAARYDVVLFVDDDNVLAREWVARLMRLFEERPSVGAVGGLNTPVFPAGHSKPAWFDMFASVYACQARAEQSGVLRKGKTLYGAGLAVRAGLLREALDSSLPLFLVGHKESNLTRGEDSEICLRISLMGWDLWYEASLRLDHMILPRRLTWDYVLRARYGGGQADAVLRLYRELVSGLTPLAFEERFEELRREWQEFWARARAASGLSREGAHSAFQRSYLDGLTDALLAMGRDEYQRIRKQLMDRYPDTAIGAHNNNAEARRRRDAKR